MRIIAVSSQKGGSGKTTLAGHLALVAEQSGIGPVGLIDTDPQASLTDWFDARAFRAKTDLDLMIPTFAKTSAHAVGDAVKAMQHEGVQLVVIDTPPAITRDIEHVMQHADLVLIPTRPSPHDLRAAGATVDLAEHCGKPLVFVINAATARAKLTTDAAIALSQHGTLAPVVLHNRQDFAASMIDGRTVLETSSNGRSADEVQRLWTYIADRLSRIPVKTAFKPQMTVLGGSVRSFGRRPAGATENHGASKIDKHVTL